jgi:hypothetical protein
VYESTGGGPMRPTYRGRRATCNGRTCAFRAGSISELTEVRAALAWYPDDVWRYVLGCAWRRIAQEEAFVGRTAEAGDELGSRLVIGRIVRDVMRLCFLLERRYVPYAKVARNRLRPPRRCMVVAYEALAARFNALELVPPVEASVRPYYGRPFRVLMADRFADPASVRSRIRGSDRCHPSQASISTSTRRTLSTPIELGAPRVSTLREPREDLSDTRSAVTAGRKALVSRHTVFAQSCIDRSRRTIRYWAITPSCCMKLS